MKYKKNCTICKREFTTSYSWTKGCSTDCRKKIEDIREANKRKNPVRKQYMKNLYKLHPYRLWSEERKRVNKIGKFYRKYGLSKEQYESMLISQNNKCAICNDVLGNGHQSHIDHNHLTGKIRQILCHRCNVALGFFRENVYILKNAVSYVEKWSL